MPSPSPACEKHFILATIAAFSHLNPLLQLALSTLELTPSLVISFLLHTNHLPGAQEMVDARSEDVKSRIKLFPVGEKLEWSEMHVKGYIAMAMGSGAVYAGILMTPSSFPPPTVFVSDTAGFFYSQVREAVDAKLGRKPLLSVSFSHQSAGHLLYLGGSEENGSMRFLDAEIGKAKQSVGGRVGEQLEISSKTKLDISSPDEETIRVYKRLVTQSDRVLTTPGHAPYHLYERYPTAAKLEGASFGWFSYMQGFARSLAKADVYLHAFPSSILEPLALEAFRADPLLVASTSSPKMDLEVGWFETLPSKDGLGDGVKQFLDKQEKGSVILVSFGTMRDPGPNCLVFLKTLVGLKRPFIYAAGRQSETFSEELKSLLKDAEDSGLGISRDWIDQVGVLESKAVGAHLSHYGVSSVIESLYAGIPVITFSLATDQPMTSALLSSPPLRVAIELLQIRSGFAIDKPILHAPNTQILGTSEALKAEFEDAIGKVFGEEGKEMGKRAKELGDKIRAKREGEWRESVVEFGKLERKE